MTKSLKLTLSYRGKNIEVELMGTDYIWLKESGKKDIVPHSDRYYSLYQRCVRAFRDIELDLIRQEFPNYSEDPETISDRHTEIERQLDRNASRQGIWAEVARDVWLSLLYHDVQREVLYQATPSVASQEAVKRYDQASNDYVDRNRVPEGW